MNDRNKSRMLYTTLVSAIILFVAGCNKPPEAVVTSPPATSVGMELDDSVITTRVKSALLGDADIKSQGCKAQDVVPKATGVRRPASRLFPIGLDGSWG